MFVLHKFIYVIYLLVVFNYTLKNIPNIKEC